MSFFDVIAAAEKNQIIEGTVIEAHDYGVVVDCLDCRVFVPKSTMGLSDDVDLNLLMGKTIPLKIIEEYLNVDQRRAVGSMREVVREKCKGYRQSQHLEGGDIYTGVVERIGQYGAFVNVCGTTGFIHISNLGVERIRHPLDAVVVGETIEVKVIAIDAEKERVSLERIVNGNNSKFALGAGLIEESFEPFVTSKSTLETYRKMNRVLSKYPLNLKAIDNVVGVLQDYIYGENTEDHDEHSAEEFFANKHDAAKKVMQTIAGIEHNRYLFPEYLSIMAQSSFIAGNWGDAVSYYERLLNQPGILNVEYSEDYYSGELETAAKIVHNICLIYLLSRQVQQALKIRQKYEYIFALQEKWTKQLIRHASIIRDSDMVEAFQQEFDQLNELYLMETFYYDNRCLLETNYLDSKEQFHKSCEVSIEGIRKVYRVQNQVIMYEEDTPSPVISITIEKF